MEAGSEKTHRMIGNFIGMLAQRKETKHWPRPAPGPGANKALNLLLCFFGVINWIRDAMLNEDRVISKDQQLRFQILRRARKNIPRSGAWERESENRKHGVDPSRQKRKSRAKTFSLNDSFWPSLSRTSKRRHALLSFFTTRESNLLKSIDGFSIPLKSQSPADPAALRRDLILQNILPSRRSGKARRVARRCRGRCGSRWAT